MPDCISNEFKYELLFSGEFIKLIYINKLLVINLDLGIKKKGKQTFNVCFPSVEDIGEGPGLGTKSVPLERRRKVTYLIL